jgi:hypothetical protein
VPIASPAHAAIATARWRVATIMASALLGSPPLLLFTNSASISGSGFLSRVGGLKALVRARANAERPAPIQDAPYKSFSAVLFEAGEEAARCRCVSLVKVGGWGLT